MSELVFRRNPTKDQKIDRDNNAFCLELSRQITEIIADSKGNPENNYKILASFIKKIIGSAFDSNFNLPHKIALLQKIEELFKKGCHAYTKVNIESDTELLEKVVDLMHKQLLTRHRYHFHEMLDYYKISQNESKLGTALKCVDPGAEYQTMKMVREHGRETVLSWWRDYKRVRIDF